MNNTMKVAGVAGTLLLIVLFVYATLSAWQHPLQFIDHSSCAATITFSELKQENDNGIYVTEVLEIEDEGSCNPRYGLRWAYIDLSLIN